VLCRAIRATQPCPSLFCMCARMDDPAVPTAGVSEIVLRFHKTKIVRIRSNGDFMMTSGGWHTATTGVQTGRGRRGDLSKELKRVAGRVLSRALSTLKPGDQPEPENAPFATILPHQILLMPPFARWLLL
jgi:hypothetical protein